MANFSVGVQILEGRYRRLEEFLQHHRLLAANTVRGYRELEQGEITIDGVRWAVMVVYAQVAFPTTSILYITLKDDLGYVLTFSASSAGDDYFPKYRKSFEAIAKSVTFRSRPPLTIGSRTQTPIFDLLNAKVDGRSLFGLTKSDAIRLFGQPTTTMDALFGQPRTLKRSQGTDDDTAHFDSLGLSLSFAHSRDTSLSCARTLVVFLVQKWHSVRKVVVGPFRGRLTPAVDSSWNKARILQEFTTTKPIVDSGENRRRQWEGSIMANAFRDAPDIIRGTIGSHSINFIMDRTGNAVESISFWTGGPLCSR